jgi:hypothetical protein
MDYLSILKELPVSQENKIFKNLGDVIWIGLIDYKGNEVSYRGYDRIPMLNYVGSPGFSKFYKGVLTNSNHMEFAPYLGGKILNVSKVVFYDSYRNTDTIFTGGSRGYNISDGDVLRIDVGSLQIGENVVEMYNKLVSGK